MIYIKEIWKDTQFEDYKISNLGNLKSFKRNKQGKLMKFYIHHGYQVAHLYINGKSKNYFVHRLVAEAFIINPDADKKTQVNHIDGNKQNNCVTNLEWVTGSENMIHAFKNGLKESPFKNKRRKVAKVDLQTNEILETYDSMYEACLKNNYSTESRHSHISDVCLGKRKSYKGFKWIYLDT